MLNHFWEESSGYEVEISKGFTAHRPSAYTSSAKDTVLDYHQPPTVKSKIPQHLYGGFARWLYTLTKFQSDTERKLAIILERNAKRWFRPAKGQFQILYKLGHDQQEYQPDFVADTEDTILILETKMASEMEALDVTAKRNAGVKWCDHATAYAKQHRGTPWKYILIPYDVVAENMTLGGLVKMFAGK